MSLDDDSPPGDDGSGSYTDEYGRTESWMSSYDESTGCTSEERSDGTVNMWCEDGSNMWTDEFGNTSSTTYDEATGCSFTTSIRASFFAGDCFDSPVAYVDTVMAGGSGWGIQFGGDRSNCPLTLTRVTITGLTAIMTQKALEFSGNLESSPVTIADSTLIGYHYAIRFAGTVTSSPVTISGSTLVSEDPASTTGVVQFDMMVTSSPLTITDSTLTTASTAGASDGVQFAGAATDSPVSCTNVDITAAANGINVIGAATRSGVSIDGGIVSAAEWITMDTQVDSDVLIDNADLKHN